MAVVGRLQTSLGRGVTPLMVIGALSAALMLSSATSSVRAEAPQHQVVSIQSEPSVESTPATASPVAVAEVSAPPVPVMTPKALAQVIKPTPVEAAPVQPAAPVVAAAPPAQPAASTAAAEPVATSVTPTSVAKPVVTEDVEIGTPCVIIRNGPSTGC